MSGNAISLKKESDYLEFVKSENKLRSEKKFNDDQHAHKNFQAKSNIGFAFLSWVMEVRHIKHRIDKKI